MDRTPVASNGHAARPDPLFNPVDYRRPLRIVLYSHDTMGLGHTRRNLLLAQALQQSSRCADILLITGVAEARGFSMADGVDCLTLPALQKNGDGRYQARQLNLPLDDVIALRAGVIESALETFDPDVLIVDKVPRGVGGELDPALAKLTARGKTRCILGLRDILDEPEAVRRDWARAGNFEVIRRHFDAIWVYGDPAVYDLAAAYGFPPDVTAMVHYTGYLDQRPRLTAPGAACEAAGNLPLPETPYALCLVGGGQDGARLAFAFAEAGFPRGMRGVVLTGPYFSNAARQELEQIAAHRNDLHVLGFVPEPGYLVRYADRIVAMGGYNTVAEILSHEKPALIVPRVSPRLEQYIRAARLNELGLLDVLHPDQLSSLAIGAWLARPDIVPPAAHSRIDLRGNWRIPSLLEGLLAGSAHNIVTMDPPEELSHGVA